MKSLIRRLSRSNSEDSSEAAKGKKPRDSSAGQNVKGRASFSEGSGDLKRLSGLPGWLNSVARHALPFQLSTSNHNTNEGDGDPVNSESHHSPETLSSAAMEPVKVEKPALNVGVVKDQQLVSTLSFEEDCQLQLAMVLSVQDNPNAVHIEAAKQISLGAFSSSGNTPAEVLAFRYWNCNVLDYDDNIVDGFYDVYGVVSGSNPEMMPSLMDLEGTPLSEGIAWEAVLVNRATDSCLKELVMNAVTLAVDSKAIAVGPLKSGLVEKIAGLVADQMGGPVIDPNEILKRWRICSEDLRASHESIVLPLGCLQVGLARHRALLFKVLADTIGIPCKLVKGRQVTGSDEWAINIIKLDDAREFIVDLMGAPGTLIPSNGSSFGVQAAVGNLKTHELKQSLVSSESGISNNCAENDGNAEMYLTDISKMPKCPVRLSQDESFAGMLSHAGKAGNQHAKTDERNLHPGNDAERQVNKPTAHQIVEFPLARPFHSRLTTSFVHKRSPSWTEGMGSPFLQDMKVKDVSHYMMNAAKENPCLAQKLHDVLLESGVVAPRNLFTADVSRQQLQSQASEDKKLLANAGKVKIEGALLERKDSSSSGLNFLSVQRPEPEERSQKLSSVEGMCERRPLSTGSTSSKASLDGHMAQPAVAVSATASVLSVVHEKLPPEVIRRVPVATAAAAATAAVVASSMVVAASKADLLSEPKFEVPIAAAATATAAVVVATSALVARKFEINEMSSYPFCEEGIEKDIQDGNFKVTDRAGKAHQGSGQDSTRSGDGILEVGSENGDRVEDFQDRDKHNGSFSTEEERHSDKSNESLSIKSDFVMDDVAEWEIPWEEIVIGERIGIGSYGEVYRGDWHGTEVAVKKFLNQDISGDALEEFRSEVRIMRRLRHPNVVLFMGAVTRVPNLSIVIEFIPRGSLYRLMHRPNNKLDERRRMRVALDVARGMNYLHSSTPMIVHRDLKSPNLLVDKNWVVKVCDFGLSRLKNSTFLSSKSTSGTPEWMAPELLRNEPSNEKCDIYSFGVILWELATLQKPWGWMSPMQVVGAVGFQHRRLDIPDYVDPAIANIVQQCWQSDPSLRPSFAEILDLLKPLQKLILPSPRSTQHTAQPRVITNL